MSQTLKLCKFCETETGIYTCPRCNCRYCSSKCFRDRNHERCSETFFQEWVCSTLRHESAGKQSKEKVMKMLKEDAEEDDDLEQVKLRGDTLYERFADLNLENRNVDERLIWERLTSEEQESFKEFLRDETKLAEIIPLKRPWWLERRIKLVTEVRMTLEMEMIKSTNSSRPPLPMNVRSISTLMTSKVPSESVKYDVIAVLFTYVFICRFYNDDFEDILEDVIDSAFFLCPVLSLRQNYESLDETIQDFLRLVIDTRFRTPVQVAKSLGSDVCLIIEGPENARPRNYVIMALNHVKMLLLNLRNAFKSSREKASNKELRLKLMLAAKKLDFFICWTCEYYEEHLKPVGLDIETKFLPEVISESVDGTVRSREFDRKGHYTVNKRVPLIEELN